MYGMLQTAFGVSCMNQASVFDWYKTIWSRWASRQFLSLPIVQTLLPVTFGYSLSSEAESKVIDTLTQADFDGVFQKLLEWYNKCIVAGGDYFEVD